MSEYREHLAQHQRLAILRCLNEFPAYRGNDSILRDSLDILGLPVTRDMVRTQLAWLAEQGLATVEQLPNSIQVATATTRGIDVATGRATVPGVQRPGPKG